MSVLVSVCLLVTTASCAKTAEPIEMPFGMWIGTVVLGGARISLGEWASLGASPGCEAAAAMRPFAVSTAAARYSS